MPPNANIIVVNGHEPNIKLREGVGNVKTIWLEYAFETPIANPTATGYANVSLLNEGNKIRSGECFVSLQRMENLVLAEYEQRRAQKEKFHYYNFTHIIPQIEFVAIHEPLHLMGLVSVDLLKGSWDANGSISHNVDDWRTTTYIMNTTYYFGDLCTKIDAYELKPMNKEYLEFICPQPQPQP